MSPFRKFTKQFSHFFTGMILAQLFSFVTFPILTRVLTKEQYGVLGLVTTTMLFAVAIAKAGLSDGVIRFYKEYSADRERLETFSSTVLMRGMVFSILTSLFYVILLLLAREYLKFDERYFLCFLIMGVYLVIRPLNIIILYFIRVNDKTIFMNVVGLVEKICSVGLSLFLLLYVFRVFYGYFVGLVIAEIVVSAVLFYWFFRHFRINPIKASKELNLKLIKFGAPLLLTELCFLLMSYADRYLIVAYLGKEALGLYSVGYNLAMYIGNIITFSLSYAIVPIYVEIYGAEGREKTEAFLKKSLQYLLMVIIPMWIGYVAISKDLFITLASEKYAIAARFSPLVLLAYFFLAVNTIFNAGLYLKKKTFIFFIISFSSIILNISMNLILLRRFGIISAAVTAAISCMVSTILAIWISRRYITVRIDLKTFFYYLGVSVVMYLVVIQVETSWAWVNLALKFIIGTLIVLAGGVYKEYESLKNLISGYRLKTA
jgi:O-antigen/teichoic acid export membrane protein